MELSFADLFGVMSETFIIFLNTQQARIQDSEGGGGFVQEFRLENRSYPDVHDFSLRMQFFIALLLMTRLHLTCAK